jgi:hypothetical protein
MWEDVEPGSRENQHYELFRFFEDEKGIKRVFIDAYFGLKNFEGERAPTGCFLTAQISPGVWSHETEYIPVSVIRAMFEQFNIEQWQAPYPYDVMSSFESKHNGIDSDIAEMMGGY